MKRRALHKRYGHMISQREDEQIMARHDRGVARAAIREEARRVYRVMQDLYMKRPTAENRRRLDAAIRRWEKARNA